MPHHDWSDKSFDWKGLSQAIRIIENWHRFARIGCNIKEKYGTIRCDSSFFDGSLHSLVFPGHYFYRWSDKVYALESRLTPIICFLRIDSLIRALQIPFYTLGYYIAMKKYPHIKDEICVDASHPQWIIGGNKIHKKYWTNI